MTVPPRLVFALCGLTAERPPLSTSTSKPSFEMNGHWEEGGTGALGGGEEDFEFEWEEWDVWDV